MESNQAPDRLHRAERPCPTGEAVATREGTTHREREDESRVASLQGVHHHHERQDCHSVDGQHATYDTFVRRRDDPHQVVVRRSVDSRLSTSRTTSGAEKIHPSVRKMGSVHRTTDIPLRPLVQSPSHVSSLPVIGPASLSRRVSAGLSMRNGPTTFGEQSTEAPAMLSHIACRYASPVA
jgi:hypothetical protein